MNKNDFILQAEGPMVQMRTNIDRARVIIGDIMSRYFQDLTNNPNTEEGKKFIVHGFKPYGIRSGIVEDSLYCIDEALKELELIMEALEKEQ